MWKIEAFELLVHVRFSYLNKLYLTVPRPPESGGGAWHYIELQICTILIWVMPSCGLCYWEPNCG